MTQSISHISTNLSIHSSVLWLIPFMPVFGAIINSIAGKLTKNNKLIDIIAMSSVAISFLLSVHFFLILLQNQTNNYLFYQTLWTWIDLGDIKIFGTIVRNMTNWNYNFDHLSGLMTILVTGIGFLIQLFSTGYMKNERQNGEYYRFISYLNLFIFSMLNLILGANILVMFLGWEGVGLCSYLLIGYYFEKKSAANAGRKAFIVNRIGDFGFLIGIFIIISIYGTTNFDHIVNMTNTILNKETITILGITQKPTYWFNIIACMLFIGACGKSAQIPLYVWLPDAMAGPTPVSALIHAATMVTSGLYMITRMNCIYTNAPLALDIILIIGTTTAIMAASIGLAQTDIKKVLAYSTVSQLGFMFMSMGTKAFSEGMFHVFTHAFFKATLFLGSGSVIMACHHNQDMRQMGGLRNLMPWTFLSMSLATCAIIGIFPFSGFFSKDEILWNIFNSWYHNGKHHGSILYLIMWIIGMIAAFMTAFYMTRLMIMTFFGDYRGEKEHTPKEVPWNMFLPITLLAILSTISGFLNIPHSLHFLTKQTCRFSLWLAPIITSNQHTINHTSINNHNVEYILMLFTTTIWIPSAIGIAYWFYIPDQSWSKAKKFTLRFNRIFKLVKNKYYIDEIYNTLFVNTYNKLCNIFSTFDRIVIDGLINNLAKFTLKLGNVMNWIDIYIIDNTITLSSIIIQHSSLIIRNIQNGQVQRYAFITYLGFLLLLYLQLINNI